MVWTIRRLFLLLFESLFHLAYGDLLGRLTLTSKVLAKKGKILDIGNITVMIQINIVENGVQLCLWGFYLDKCKTIFECFSKLSQAHDSLSSPLVKTVAMKSLDGQLAEMLLHAEVGLLVKTNVRTTSKLWRHHCLYHSGKHFWQRRQPPPCSHSEFLPRLFRSHYSRTHS